MNQRILIISFVLLVIALSINGQGQGLVDQTRSTIDCPGKMGECKYFLPEAKVKTDNKNKYCCNLKAWARCTQLKIANYCPSQSWESIANPIPDINNECKEFNFWTPECIWHNYMYEVIGAAAGVAGILIILIIICCCCCCRSQK